MQPVEQELPTLPEHLSSTPLFSGVRVTRSLVLYVYFVDHCLPICTFSFGHCVVYSSSIYDSAPLVSINNSRFAKFLPLIYPPELEVNETTYTTSSASFLDLYLAFDDSGQLNTKIYDKRDDFNFKIINFPNMCRNRPASPAYGVYI